ncbi:MAG TPA: hypothetical protein VLR94_01450 [Acidobacteriota bacterium]|nr:hypothetical protein [Acidobacteriota bacterium]
MKRTLVSFGFAALALFLVWTAASACGDKFLVVGRGIRYERAYAAVHPGSILIYRNMNYEDPKSGTDLEKALRKAGHKIETVDDVTKLDATLKTGKFDLVVLNLADTPLLEDQIIKSPSKPAVLPIIYNRTGAELDAAGKKYDCILKASGKNTNVLQVVDEAVGERQKGEPVKCKWSK